MNTKDKVVRHAAYGQTKALRKVLDAGGNPNAEDGGYTALHYACQEGHLDAIRILVEAGARVDILDNNMTPLFNACGGGTALAVVALLIELGADVNFRTSLGVPLHNACAWGEREKVILLLAAGAHTDLLNDEDESVLVNADPDLLADPEIRTALTVR